jgi:hypothetical protein
MSSPDKSSLVARLTVVPMTVGQIVHWLAPEERHAEE